MATEIEVSFPENLKVQTKVGEFTIMTDQDKESGGDGTAASPFALFTSSIAACAGYYALKFCRTREIDPAGMTLKLCYEWDEKQKRYPKMLIELKLPREFPDKYRKAILKAMDQCTVKRHILQPPEFEMSLI